MSWLNEFIYSLPTWPFTIIAALIAMLVALYIFRLKAARHFRLIIYTELKGIYPEPRITADQANAQIRQSIKEIESASSEFKRFVTFYRKRAFDATVRKYCKTAKEIDWNKHTQRGWFPSMNHLPQCRDPKPDFFNCIEELLNFAK
jgi:hypothetical protein